MHWQSELRKKASQIQIRRDRARVLFIIVLLSFNARELFLLSLLLSFSLFLRLRFFQFFYCLSSGVAHGTGFFLGHNKECYLFSFVLQPLIPFDVNDSWDALHGQGTLLEKSISAIAIFVEGLQTEDEKRETRNVIGRGFSCYFRGRCCLSRRLSCRRLLKLFYSPCARSGRTI